MNAPFEPTSCACPADQANCTRQPGHLLPGQLTEILAHLGEVNAAKYFWNSPGMLLASSRRPGEVFRLRTITPRFENGKCIFYEAGRCHIHEVAPFGCRYFDVHMNGVEGDRRARWGLNQLLDRRADYERERDALPEATHYQPRTGV